MLITIVTNDHGSAAYAGHLTLNKMKEMVGDWLKESPDLLRHQNWKQRPDGTWLSLIGETEEVYFVWSHDRVRLGYGPVLERGDLR